MVTFDQGLESGLDLRPARVLLQTQCMQGFASRIMHRSRLDPLLLGALAARCAELLPNVEWIGCVEARHAFARRAAAGPHFPGRSMTRDGVFLITRNRLVAHAGEKIIGTIVLADVIEAEAPVLVFLATPLGRAMR